MLGRAGAGAGAGAAVTTGDEDGAAVVDKGQYWPAAVDLAFSPALPTDSWLSILSLWAGLIRRGRPDCRT